MNAPDKFQQLLSLTREPFPASKKIYLEGSQKDILVPIREVQLTNGDQAHLYDTSGPYTDPTASIDVRAGLPTVRTPWIQARGDTESYEGRSHQVEAYKRLTAERGAPLMGGLTNWGGNQLKSLLWHMHPSLGLSVDKYDPTNLALGTAAGLYGLKKFMEPEQPNVYGGMSGMPRFGYY